MLTLACRDLGMDCNQLTTGNTVAEVKRLTMVHAQETHGEMLKSMSSPAQLVEMDKLMESKIK